MNLANFDYEEESANTRWNGKRGFLKQKNTVSNEKHESANPQHTAVKLQLSLFFFAISVTQNIKHHEYIHEPVLL